MSLQQIIEGEIENIMFLDVLSSHKDGRERIRQRLHRIIKAAFEECAVEDDESTCENKGNCLTCAYIDGYNAANKARATNEEKVLATLQP